MNVRFKSSSLFIFCKVRKTGLCVTNQTAKINFCLFCRKIFYILKNSLTVLIKAIRIILLHHVFWICKRHQIDARFLCNPLYVVKEISSSKFLSNVDELSKYGSNCSKLWIERNDAHLSHRGPSWISCSVGSLVWLAVNSLNANWFITDPTIVKPKKIKRRDIPT